MTFITINPVKDNAGWHLAVCRCAPDISQHHSQVPSKEINPADGIKAAGPVRRRMLMAIELCPSAGPDAPKPVLV
jgi:hypothetical protein